MALPVTPSLVLNDGPNKRLSAAALRQLCLDCGVDDVGFVDLGRPALDEERDNILGVYAKTRSIIALVGLANREALQSPARYIGNVEMHRTTEAIDHMTVKIVRELNKAGVRALGDHVGFPMNVERWPGRIWDVPHKTMAVQAGLGHMGLHRNVIHPELGNHILLNSILVDAEIDAYGQPLVDSPCFNCNLCVSACPVGAIGRDGTFDFHACMTHNYHDFMGGFVRFVDEVIDAPDSATYRESIRDSESAGTWQSLTTGPSYKAGYCWAVCPAGTDPMSLYEPDTKDYVNTVLRPLRDREESVYVTKGSRAEKIATKLKHKEVRHVTTPIRNLNELTFPAPPRARPPGADQESSEET